MLVWYYLLKLYLQVIENPEWLNILNKLIWIHWSFMRSLVYPVNSICNWIFRFLQNIPFHWDRKKRVYNIPWPVIQNWEELFEIIESFETRPLASLLLKTKENIYILKNSTESGAQSPESSLQSQEPRVQSPVQSPVLVLDYAYLFPRTVQPIKWEYIVPSRVYSITPPPENMPTNHQMNAADSDRSHK